MDDIVPSGNDGRKEDRRGQEMLGKGSNSIANGLLVWRCHHKGLHSAPYCIVICLLSYETWAAAVNFPGNQLQEMFFYVCLLQSFLHLLPPLIMPSGRLSPRALLSCPLIAP